MGIEALVLAIAIPSAIAGLGLGVTLMTVAINGAVQANRRNKEYYKRLNAMLDASPTYSGGYLATQTNNCLAVPITYGEVKVAGNTIWQDDSNGTLSKVISFGTGEIESIYDIDVNDKAIGSYAGVSYSAYRGTMSQQIDSRVHGATQEDKVNRVGGLKGIAYIAVTAPANSQLASCFNLTAKLKGQKVKVYSNLSEFEVKYSNNPAWCILDFITSYNGCALDMSEIDLSTFLESAQYCDEEVGEKDKKQKRFTMNLVLDERRSRLEWLDMMLMTCRGYVTYQSGKLSMKIEKPEETMQVFTPDHILMNSERFWTTPREKRTDIFKVQYIDPNNEYAKIYATAEAEEFENEQPIVQEARVFGVTNFNQASRLAWYYLNQAKTCNKFISFKTSQEGLDRTVGDVIEITSTFLGYEHKKMRIIHMAEAQEGQIEIACKEYNPDLYCDKLGSAEPIANSVTLPSLFATPPTPENLVLEEYGYRTPEGNHISSIIVKYDAVNYIYFNRYEISYSNDEGETWNQGNVSYNNMFLIPNVEIGRKYLIKVQTINNREVFSEPAEASVLTVGKNNPPQAPKDLILIQKGDFLKAMITPPDDPDIAGYEIRIGTDWENSELVHCCIETSTMFRPTQNGTACYLIKAVDNVGNYSETATRAVLEISGIMPKNIIIEKTFTQEDLIIEDNEILLPVMDLGVNFQDYRQMRETRLFVNFESEANIMYRCAYSDFKGWDYLVSDEDEWEDNAPTMWSDWKLHTQEPTFCGQYLQVKIIGENLDQIPSINIIADVEDIEDTVTNIEIPAKITTVTLNKNFTVPPVIIPTTVDETGKTCAWRVTHSDLHHFDIELLDKNDNTIKGKILSATARGY